MKRIVVVAFLLFLFTAPVFAGEDCKWRVELEGGWCCKNLASWLACNAALGNPLKSKEGCYSCGCSQDFLSQIEQERKERKRQEEARQKRIQEEFDRKKRRERAEKDMQRWFEHKKEEVRPINKPTPNVAPPPSASSNPEPTHVERFPPPIINPRVNRGTHKEIDWDNTFPKTLRKR